MSNHEEEQKEVSLQLELLALLEGLYKLENEVKSQYWAYDFPYERPISYSLPMVREEINDLLRHMYRLMYYLKDFVKRTQSYDYYRRIIDRYFEEIKPYSKHYGFSYTYKDFLEDKERLNNLTEEEKYDLERAEMVSQMFNRPEIYEQMKRKIQWNKLSFEERLEKVVDEWYKEFVKRRQELSKEQPRYGCYTLEQWIQKLNLTGRGKKLAQEKPWMLTTPGGRHILKKVDKEEIIL